MRLLYFLFAIALLREASAQSLGLDSLKQQLKFADGEQAAVIAYEIVSIMARTDHSNSIIYVRKADSLLQAHNTPLVRCFTYMARGSYQSMTGAMDSCAANYLRAADQLHNIPDSVVHARVYSALGYALIGTGRHRQAIDALIRTLYIAERHPVNETVRAFAIVDLTWAYLELKQYEESIRVARPALKWMNPATQARPLSFLYNNMAASFSALHQSDSVQFYAGKVVKLGEELNQFEQVANAYFIIGRDYSERGEYEKALENYLKAQPYRDRAANPFFMIADLYTLSDLYYKLKNYRKGVETGEQAVALARKHNIRMKMEHSYQALVNNYSGIGDYEKATRY